MHIVAAGTSHETSSRTDLICTDLRRCSTANCTDRQQPWNDGFLLIQWQPHALLVDAKRSNDREEDPAEPPHDAAYKCQPETFEGASLLECQAHNLRHLHTHSCDRESCRVKLRTVLLSYAEEPGQLGVPTFVGQTHGVQHQRSDEGIRNLTSNCAKLQVCPQGRHITLHRQIHIHLLLNRAAAQEWATPHDSTAPVLALKVRKRRSCDAKGMLNVPYTCRDAHDLVASSVGSAPNRPPCRETK